MLRKLRSRFFTALLLGAVCLVGAPTGLAVEFANVDVADDLADPLLDNVTVTIPAGQSTANFFLDGVPNRGDYGVRIGPSFADDASGGVLLSYVRENGRAQLDSLGSPERIYSITSTYRSGSNPGQLFVGGHRAGAVPLATDGDASQDSLWLDRDEHNPNFAAAYFPFSEGWQAGSVYNAINGGVFNEIVASPGITLGPGQNFEQDVFGTGDHLLQLPGVTDSRRQGLLFVGGAKNESNFALSEPTADGAGYNITGHDSATNGSGGEVDPVSFVFMPLGTPNVTMARIFARGHGPSPEPVAMIKSGSNFTISRESAGEYRLSIAGQTPGSGTLLVSPSGSNDGNHGNNVDNTVTYEADGNDWIILSQDGPTLTGAGQDSGTRAESYFSFAFMPFGSAPTAPGPIPSVNSLTNFNKGRVIGWNANITHVNGTNSPGSIFIDEPNQTADVDIVSLFESRGDNVFAVDGAFIGRDEGVMFATVSEGLRDNSGLGGLFDYGVLAVSQSLDEEWWVHTNAADSLSGEHNVNFSVAFFGADTGFDVGQHIATTGGALEVLIPGENSQTDGALFVTVNAANQANFVSATPKGDGTGWDIAHFDGDPSAVAEESVNHIYLPFDADNLVAGRVNANGTIAASTDTGDFSLTKSADGTYLLTVNGKTPSDGMLLLTSTGEGAGADNSLVYEPAGSQFRILGLDMITEIESGNGDIVDLEDTAFMFAYIDFDNPVALASVGLAGDFNNDGIVNAADYTVWRDNEGSATALQNDGGLGTPIGAAHYNLWVASFGNSSLSSGTSVPEPTSIVLLGLAFGFMGVRSRKS